MYAFNAPKREVVQRPPHPILAGWRGFRSGSALIRRCAVGDMALVVLRGIARPCMEAFPKLGDGRLVETVASEVI
jgi:hypothetical protein